MFPFFVILLIDCLPKFFMRKFLLLSFLYLIMAPVYSQKALIDAENTLVTNYNKILDSKVDKDRNAANQIFYQNLKQALMLSGAFDYPFDKLVTISILSPDDKAIRLFTWNLQNDAGEEDFFGLIELNPSLTKNKANKVIELINQKGELQKSDNKTFNADKWPGAVYYEVVPVKKGNTTYYTLAGWRGIDDGLKQKILDIVYIQSAKAKFGYPLFKMSNRTQRRVIFTFGGMTSMLLTFDDKNHRFVFEHLAPKNNLVVGNYRFYGPDGVYDSFVLEKKQWIYQSDIDVRNNKSSRDIFYNSPTKVKVKK